MSNANEVASLLTRAETAEQRLRILEPNYEAMRLLFELNPTAAFSRALTAEAALRKAQEGGHCPFCGGLGVLVQDGNIGKYRKLWIICNDCGANGPKFPLYPTTGTKCGDELAWSAWRKREASSVQNGTAANTPPGNPEDSASSISTAEAKPTYEGDLLA